MPRLFSNNSANYFDAGDVTQFPQPFITVSAWVRFNSVASEQAIVGKFSNVSSTSEWLLKATVSAGQKLLFATTNGGGSYTIVTGATNLTTGRWYHVAGQQAVDGARVWLDGKLDAFLGTTKVWPNTATALRIGRITASTEPLDAALAHVAVWYDALNYFEIFQLSQGALPSNIRPTRLGAWWPLEEGGDARDRSVWNITATQNGSVPPVRDQDLLVGQHMLQMSAAEGLGELDIGVPRLIMRANGYEPELEGPEQIFAPFTTIGVEPFVPTTPGVIAPPFFTLGFHAGPVLPGSSPVTDVTPVDLAEGALPPFVPPSLPPTLGGGAGPGGGGGVTPPVGPGVPLPPLSSGGLAGIRFYQGPPWRWVVTDLETNTITFLDRLTLAAEVTYGLNRGSTAKLTVPSANPEVNILHTDGEPFVSEGNRLLYGFRREGVDPLWKVRFAGKILQVEDTGETENAQTIITAFDPWHLLYQRPMINEDGDFPDEAGFFSFDDTQAGNIALIFLRNTILNNGSGLNDHGDLGIDTGDGAFPGAEPGNLPGTPYWDGVYENTTQRDTFCQQGMMVGEVWDQQLETGSLDIVMTPVYDPVNRPGYMVDLSIYELVGSQKDDAVFAWDKPSRNLIAINALKDGTKRANTIRYYYGEGGPPSGGGIPLSYGPSIIKYGETWHQQFYPGRIDVVVNALATLQLELMEDGIKTVHVTPSPERMPFLFTEFWLGDTVPVFASSNLRQQIAGYQRIYGVVLSIDENSYEQVPQLLVSPEDA